MEASHAIIPVRATIETRRIRICFCFMDMACQQGTVPLLIEFMAWTRLSLKQLYLLAPLLVCGIAVVIACNSKPTPSGSSPESGNPASKPGLFRDLTPGSGIAFTYRNGEEAYRLAILETLGGGVALLAYDGDGLLDIFVTGGGYFEDKEIRG